VHICTGTGLTPSTSAPGLGSPPPHLLRDSAHPCAHLHRDWAHPCAHLHRDWAHPCHICAGTGLIHATSAPGLGSPPPQLHRDWAHPCHICAAAGLAAAARAAEPQGHGTHGHVWTHAPDSLSRVVRARRSVIRSAEHTNHARRRKAFQIAPCVCSCSRACLCCARASVLAHLIGSPHTSQHAWTHAQSATRMGSRARTCVQRHTQARSACLHRFGWAGGTARMTGGSGLSQLASALSSPAERPPVDARARASASPAT
jgi:hypothetical protein